MLGFGTFWVPEDPFYRGAFTVASAIACGTSKIKIGLGIVNPYLRHPALTAMEFAALDELADGRAILGIGAGLKDWIEGRLKIPYTDADIRDARDGRDRPAILSRRGAHFRRPCLQMPSGSN